MWWIISLVGVVILALQIYRLATGGFSQYGFTSIMYMIVGLGIIYFGYTMRPAPALAPVYPPMTAGRRRGGRYRW